MKDYISDGSDGELGGGGCNFNCILNLAWIGGGGGVEFNYNNHGFDRGRKRREEGSGRCNFNCIYNLEREVEIN